MGDADLSSQAAPLFLSLLEAVIAAAPEPPLTALVDGVSRLCHDLKSAAFAAPLVAFLSGPQCEALLPLLLRLPPAEQKAALVKLMHASRRRCRRRG